MSEENNSVDENENVEPEVQETQVEEQKSEVGNELDISHIQETEAEPEEEYEEPEGPETQKFVTIETKFDGKTVLLKSEKLTSGWLTTLTIGDRQFQPIDHEISLSEYESKRDNKIAHIISIELDISVKKATKIVYDLINTVDRDVINRIIDDIAEKSDADIRIRIAQFEANRQAAINAKNKQTNEIAELYNKLCNKDGQYTVEQILDARVQLKKLMMSTFWTIEGQNPRTGNPGHLSLKKLPIADYISKAFNIMHFGCRNWWYDWERAYYTYDAEDLLIQQEVDGIIDTVGDTQHKYNGNSINDKAQIIDHASMKRVSIENPFNRCRNMINARNGVLKLDYENHTVEVLGKRPEYMFSYCIDTVYDPNADPTPVHNMLVEIVGEDQVDLIYQMAAIAIRDTDHTIDSSKVAYFLLGRKNAGKNAIIRVLSDFLGKRIVSTIPLHQLAENKFVKPMLEGKLLNADDELPKTLPLNESRELKSLTGGKHHMVEPKNVKPYDAIITALLLFAGNQYPRCNIPADDDAFWGRWDVIHCPNQFKVKEGYTSSILTPENLSGFFNKVIEKLFDIHDNGIRRVITNIYDEWMYSSSNVYRFIEDMTVESDFPCDYPKNSLYEYYQRWCDAKGIPKADRCSSLPEFGRELMSKCKVKDVRMGSGERSHVYRMHRRYEHFLLMSVLGLQGDA
jgi:P4 family phage/plasmid primase-like protien